MRGIDVLIEVDYLSHFTNGKCRYSGIYTFLSLGGLIPFGLLPKWAQHTILFVERIPVRNKCVRVICESDLTIEQLWELESIGISEEVMLPSEVVTVDWVKFQIRITEKGCHASAFKTTERL